MEEKDTQYNTNQREYKNRKEKILKYLSEEISRDKRRKKEVLHQILEELLPEIQNLLSQGTSKAKLYRAINRYLEEEGIGKVSYKHFLTILNEVLKQTRKRSSQPTSSRPDKVDPLKLL